MDKWSHVHMYHLSNYHTELNITAYSENLVVHHFEKNNLGGIRQTPLRCSIHTGHVF